MDSGTKQASAEIVSLPKKIALLSSENPSSKCLIIALEHIFEIRALQCRGTSELSTYLKISCSGGAVIHLNEAPYRILDLNSKKIL